MAIVAISCTNDEVEIISSMPQNEFDSIIGKIEISSMIGEIKPQATEVPIFVDTRIYRSKHQVDSILKANFGNSAEYRLDSVVLYYGSKQKKLDHSVNISYFKENGETHDNEWHAISIMLEKGEDCYMQPVAYFDLNLKNHYTKKNKKYFYENWSNPVGYYYKGEIVQIYSKNIQEPEAIDLGLSVKWASCNLGGFTPSCSGVMAVWGDPSGNVLEGADYDGYGIKNAPYNISGTEYDIVKAMLGGNWRLPTAEEVQELIDNCSSGLYIYDDNRLYYEYVGPNGNSIKFLYNEKDINYMTGTLDEVLYNRIFFWVNDFAVEGRLGRSSANDLFYIRPVLDE